MLHMSENDVPRRTFLRTASAATALSYSRVYGANERIQLGLIGCGERGRYDMGNFVKSTKVDVVAALRHLRQQSSTPRKDRRAQRQDLQRSSQAARDQGSRCRPDRRSRPLACRLRHRRPERRQGRLRRKAADPQNRRGPRHRQGRARQQSRLPGRHAAALRQALYRGQAAVHRYRQARQDHPRPHLVARQYGYHLRKAPASLAEAALATSIGRTSSAR